MAWIYIKRALYHITVLLHCILFNFSFSLLDTWCGLKLEIQWLKTCFDSTMILLNATTHRKCSIKLQVQWKVQIWCSCWSGSDHQAHLYALLISIEWNIRKRMDRNEIPANICTILVFAWCLVSVGYFFKLISFGLKDTKWKQSNSLWYHSHFLCILNTDGCFSWYKLKSQIISAAWRGQCVRVFGVYRGSGDKWCSWVLLSKLLTNLIIECLCNPVYWSLKRPLTWSYQVR